MNPRLKPLTAALSIAFLTPAHAAAADNLDPVIVTATRFSEPEVNVPANISVITRDDIRNTPATDLPSMLKSSAGVDVRALYGSLGIDSTVDIRGFGETAGSNTLILLDGQRLNPIDLGSVNWSAIPLDSVQRIEVQRGAGTVLYGDKATGGVVNIITDKSGTPRAGATIGIGSYDTQTVDANAAAGNETGYFNVFGHYAHTGGWRENSQAEQAALSGRGALYIGQGEGFIDYSISESHNGLPGPLLSAAYQANPKTASTPYDSQRSNGYRFRPGIALPVTDTLRIEGEVSFDRQDSHANYVSFGSEADRARDNWSLTPRLRWQHGLGSLKSETVAGIDYYSGKVQRDLHHIRQPERQTGQSGLLFPEHHRVRRRLGGHRRRAQSAGRPVGDAGPLPWLLRPATGPQRQRGLFQERLGSRADVFRKRLAYLRQGRHHLPFRHHG